MRINHCEFCVSVDMNSIFNYFREQHKKRSPDCSFFLLVNNHKPSPKRTKSKKGRASKVSRLSTQSTFTIASDTASIADLPAEEGDSILTTATNATTTTQGGRKMVKAKKVAAGKGRKTKAKMDEVIEIAPAVEPEDDDFEVKIEAPPKPTRGRKRKSEESIDLDVAVVEPQPPTKRRATRTRASTALNDHATPVSVAVEEASKPVGRKKGRASSARSTRKASAASVATFPALIPNDDEIDAALEADLERRITDDEAPLPPPNKRGRASKVIKTDHAMFGTSPMEIDEAVIESELQALEAESRPLPKAKGAKGKQVRKVSAKQQAAIRKAAEEEAEAEAEAKRLAEEEEEASQQIAAELEHSLSIQHSSPIVQPKRQKASSRQPGNRPPIRSTRASGLTVDDSNFNMTDDFQDALDEQNNDSGNETDASMASQSTVVRGGSTRRGSTLKKGRGGKKATASRNIEEIVLKPKHVIVEEATEDVPMPTVEAMEISKQESTTMRDEVFYTPAPEVPVSAEAHVVEEPAPKRAQAKAAPKGRGRPVKAAPASVVESNNEPEPIVEESVRPNSKNAKGKQVARQPSPTPPPKEVTPVLESPQSSDAENHPPSSKAPASMRKPTTPRANTTRIPLASTPMLSPSKRNIIAGLQSSQPWTDVDLDAVFMGTPGDENGPASFGDMIAGKMNGGNLTSPERKMSVEEWIQYNAEMAEDRLRGECERMVGAFEREGGRAMRALEAVECVE